MLVSYQDLDFHDSLQPGLFRSFTRAQKTGIHVTDSLYVRSVPGPLIYVNCKATRATL